MGGFRVALDKLGGQCVFASEVDRFCVRNYQANFGDRPAGDITRIETEQIPHHDLLVGGFPCQPFSSSGAREGMNDPKGVLFREISRILKAKQPRAFLLENVRGLFIHDEGKTLKIVVQELEECGYRVSCQLADVVQVLPQERCRLFLAGTRLDIPSSGYTFPVFPRLERGVRDILDSNLSADQVDRLTLSPHQLEKVRSQQYTQRFPEARFLSDPTVPAKTLQSSYTKYMVGTQFVPVGSGSDAAWRRFSSREAARLQGFPEDFILCPERPYHMIGNAVAPPVIAMIAAPLLQCVSLVDKDEGWKVGKEMLLDATPDDGRRSGLKLILDDIETGE